MLKINIGFFFLIIYLAICTQHTTCAQVSQNYSLRKFAINFKEAIKLNSMKKFLQKQKEAEEKRKEEEKRRKEEEEKKKMENIESLRRKVFQEYLLNHITGKTTVLKDFFSRF
jgi:hypothetical protein